MFEFRSRQIRQIEQCALVGNLGKRKKKETKRWKNKLKKGQEMKIKLSFVSLRPRFIGEKNIQLKCI